MTSADRVLLRLDALVWGLERRRFGGPWTATLCPGEAIAVLGPNGVGKTTLFRTLIGAVPALSGSATWGGDASPPVRVPADLAARVAFVPQQGEAAADLSVEDYALLGRIARRGWFARPSPADRAMVVAALARLGLEGLGKRPLVRLSGGERQLAGLARALVQQASVLIVDEPLASLDPANQHRVQSQIAALVADGLAVIFSTHQPEHAHRLAGRVLAVDGRGAGVFGRSDDVLTGPVLTRLYGIPVRRLETAGHTLFPAGTP